jgi:hypothetical protein
MADNSLTARFPWMHFGTGSSGGTSDATSGSSEPSGGFYSLVHAMRKPKSPTVESKSPTLPPSDRQTLTPNYLLHHENHFDPNTFTPEQMHEKVGKKALETA